MPCFGPAWGTSAVSQLVQVLQGPLLINRRSQTIAGHRSGDEAVETGAGRVKAAAASSSSSVAVPLRLGQLSAFPFSVSDKACSHHFTASGLEQKY